MELSDARRLKAGKAESKGLQRLLAESLQRPLWVDS